MECDNLKVICYMGGTCGDLISAMIDLSGGVKFQGKAIWLPDDRIKLKKPHLFKSTSEKNDYITAVSKTYRSIPSHDLEYHITNKHDFISIVVTDINSAHTAAKRFKNLHRPQVWQEMQKFSGADTVEKYARMMLDYSTMIISNDYSSCLIDLAKILSGHAVEELEKHKINLDVGAKNLYNNWLDLQNDTFII